jgi:hypothetical protein
MLWFHFPANFFAGVFFANFVPHFVSGVLGRTFPMTPVFAAAIARRAQESSTAPLRRETSTWAGRDRTRARAAAR